MTPAALEANRRNAKKAGRPKGGMNADKLELSAQDVGVTSRSQFNFSTE
jgi:hypothetical protein